MCKQIQKETASVKRHILLLIFVSVFKEWWKWDCKLQTNGWVESSWLCSGLQQCKWKFCGSELLYICTMVTLSRGMRTVIVLLLRVIMSKQVLECWILFFIPGQLKRQFNEQKVKIHGNLFDLELYRVFFLSVNVIFCLLSVASIYQHRSVVYLNKYSILQLRLAFLVLIVLLQYWKAVTIVFNVSVHK